MGKFLCFVSEYLCILSMFWGFYPGWWWGYNLLRLHIWSLKLTLVFGSYLCDSSGSLRIDVVWLSEFISQRTVLLRGTIFLWSGSGIVLVSVSPLINIFWSGTRWWSKWFVFIIIFISWDEPGRNRVEVGWCVEKQR